MCLSFSRNLSICRDLAFCSSSSCDCRQIRPTRLGQHVDMAAPVVRNWRWLFGSALEDTWLSAGSRLAPRCRWPRQLQHQPLQISIVASEDDLSSLSSSAQQQNATVFTSSARHSTFWLSFVPYATKTHRVLLEFSQLAC